MDIIKNLLTSEYFKLFAFKHIITNKDLYSEI